MYLDISSLVDTLCSSYAELGAINDTRAWDSLPNQHEVIALTRALLNIIFPGYYEEDDLIHSDPQQVLEQRLIDISQRLIQQIARCLSSSPTELAYEACLIRAKELTQDCLAKLPTIRRILFSDIEAAFTGDPACTSRHEVIMCYPGLFAIAVQRLAHLFYQHHIPLLPRIMTEYAHYHTGIDIHPGATIGDFFFIDHGTGVVIGETSVIGNHVRMYMGITLGAKSLPQDARKLSGQKRHPTIEDDVVIYANATLLGNITIGKGAVIGGNCWITESIPAGTHVMIEPPKLRKGV